jgi:catechol 2,3-dioxygenase-like lactoylglutathione lyase family enzyme
MAIAHITLATRNIHSTSRFFAAAFGWRPIDRPSNIPHPAAWLQIALGQELHLIELDDFQASPFEREYGRHVALSYPVAEFAALKERLVEQGAELIEPKRATPTERFFFRDPNGYIFEVVAAKGE